MMRAVRRCNATGEFSWIGSDGWSARDLVSIGNEPEVEGTLSVQPQANPVQGFEQYFLNLTVENNKRNPWFVGESIKNNGKIINALSLQEFGREFQRLLPMLVNPHTRSYAGAS
ncbi:hypothetical protein AAG570_009547 [Ranatra chinensis]|uniref:Uncharacterized protein n=1 Tax=Ranatra chinensis TaxID=642074 RepID=A0ABD0YPE9_9HEMI